MSDEMIIILTVLGVGLILGILIVFIVKSHKKNMKKIIQTTSPIWVKFIDVLVYEVSSGDDNITVYLPVYQNKRDNKVYVTSRWGNHGYVYPRIEGLFSSNPKIVTKNIKKEDVEFNKEGRLYIEKEKGTLKVENNTITIENRKFTYEEKFKKTLKLNTIYNLNNDNILEIINNATIYEGIADFDIEGILKEKLN
jgi:hypothetical protein